MVAFDLSLGLRVPGIAVFEPHPRRGERAFEVVGVGADETVGVFGAVVGERGCGDAVWNVSSMTGLFTCSNAWMYRILREWSSRHETISTPSAACSGQWVKSDCHSSLGSAASNRRRLDFGRLRGSTTTRPALTRMRWMVEFAGGLTPARSSLAAMIRPLRPAPARPTRRAAR